MASNRDRENDPRTARPKENLTGQIEENRNLTGSSTWETLPENEPEDKQTKEKNPPRTTTGKMTAPKFGSAGSGGAELVAGPERP